MLSSIKIRNVVLYTILVVTCTTGVGIYLIFSDESTQRTVLLATGVCASAIITALIALWSSSMVTRPVDKLRKFVEKISQGDFNQQIVSTSTDEIGKLTMSLKEMAGRLQETVALISRERDRLSAILSQMGDAVFIVDDDSRILLSNPAAERIFQFPGSGMGEYTFIEIVKDVELDIVLQHCKETQKQQNSFVESRPTRQFLGIMVTPLGAKNGYLVVIQDLTRLRRLETVRRDFVANISHELRTPIASIKALSETLTDGAIEDRAVARSFLEKINTESDKLSQMVQELVELSQIESGQAALNKTVSEINEPIEHAVSRLRPLADRAGVTLKTEVTPELPSIMLDKERIEQVLVNLIHNAIKFTRPTGKIIVSAILQDRRIVVSVADTGTGISEDDLPRIFERFYKTDKSRRSGGTGLGLSIAKHIIQGHGGEISAHSEQGKGSTFVFTLPV